MCRRGQLPRENHLEGDGAVQCHLAGLVDHAHAAAADLLQQLVVAEVADARPGGGCGLSRCQRRGLGQRGFLTTKGGCQPPQRLGETFDPRPAGEELAQLRRELRVAGQHAVPVHGPARLGRLDAGDEDLLQPLFPPGQVAVLSVHDSCLVRQERAQFLQGSKEQGGDGPFAAAHFAGHVRQGPTLQMVPFHR